MSTMMVTFDSCDCDNLLEMVCKNAVKDVKRKEEFQIIQDSIGLTTK